MARRTAASAWSKFAAMMTPLPAASPSAFTTTGQPNVPWRRAVSAAAAESHTIARAVGTPWRAISSFANALLVSSCAAARVGPKIGRPAAGKWSATPAASGASGPMTVRSTPSASARASTAAGSTASRGRVRTSRAMPGLPGAQTTDAPPLERGRQGVFAGAGPDDEQLHACIRSVFSGLRRSAQSCASASFARIPWANSCDSLAYSPGQP